MARPRLRSPKITRSRLLKLVQSADRRVMKVLISTPAVLAALAVALVASPAPADSGAESAATERISVRDDRFSPKSASIRRGTKVVWSWKGDNPHNVRFRKAPSGVKRPKGSDTQTSGRFARKFRDRGRYRYVCTIHEDLGMEGSLRVR
jgi:plastocyanin